MNETEAFVQQIEELMPVKWYTPEQFVEFSAAVLMKAPLGALRFVPAVPGSTRFGIAYGGFRHFVVESTPWRGFAKYTRAALPREGRVVT